MGTAPNTPSLQRIWLGREREVAALDAGLDDLLAGRGGLFLLTGEPGIGKTRLADEVGRSAMARQVAVHWGRAWEVGGAPSYWPFVQVLRSLCRGLDAAEVARRVGPHAAELAELLPELRALAPAAADHPRDRFRLFEAVNAFLYAAAAAGPQLVVLDDLHAADPSSLQLLHFLVRDLRSRSLLLIGTYREAEARLATETGRTLALVSREACVIPLRRLDRSEVADFVTQSTGATLDDARVEALHQRTEGNPLFLRELLQLQRTVGRPPEGIREVVRARLALSTPVARRVLEAAAVLGREFAIEPLAITAEMPEPEIRDAIEAATEAGIVEPLDQPARWRFTHVLLREGLYQDLEPARRAALHGRAATSLGRHVGEPPLSELAHHLLNAIPAVTLAAAAEAAMRAAERAMTVLACEDACALLDRARALLEDAAGEERRLFEVLLALGLARIRAADIAAGKDTCRRAAEIARRLGDGELFARAVLGSAYEFVPGVRDLPLIALLEEALALLPPGDGALRARCMVQLAVERQPEPDTRPPVELARAAIAMARRAGDPETLRFTLASAGMAMLVYGDPVEQLAINGEALRLALAAGDSMVAVRAHLFLASVCFEQGDPAGAAAHARGYEAVAERHRHAHFRWVTRSMHGMRAMWDGRFADAARAYHDAEEIYRQDEARGVSMVAVPVGLARATERQEDLPGIEAQIRARFGAVHQDLGGCIGEMLIAHLHGRGGDRPRAAAQLATVTAHPLFVEIKEAAWLALLVDACHLVSDVALARHLYPRLEPRARQFHNLGPMSAYMEPPYARQLGLLAWILGRLDDAVAHLAEAEARVAEVGMRSHLARLRYELAGALLARGGADDRARAASLLVDARTVAEELGQVGLLPLVAARAALAGDAPARVADASGPSFALRREGDTWAIVSGTRTLRLRDSRGLQLLDQLLASPGQELHVLQLVSSADDAGSVDGGDAGAVLDPEAVQRYRRRLLDLREELEEAEAFADSGRTGRARHEIEILTQELARAVGLGGRERRSGSAAERARTTVQKRLRSAIERIKDGLPELGLHLEHTIRTGTFCGYLPDGRR